MKDKSKVKICFVSGAIARSGGTERVGSIIANSLCNRGYDVYLLSCWNHGKPYFYLKPDVHLHYLLEPKKEGKLYRTYIYPMLKMHKFIKDNVIDIIVDIDTELSIYSSYAIKRTECKLISWEHFNYWTMLRLKEKKRFRAKKLIKKYASKLVVLTEQDRQAHINNMGFSPNSILAFANPCMNITESPYNFDSHVFLAVGRLTHPKGYDWLLEAWSIVEECISDWKLVIVGSGEDDKMLKAKMNFLKLKYVNFVGHTDDVGAYYSKGSCFVLSSRYEGFPMVLLEAEASGLPVVSFDCKTGPRDLVVDGKTGYLVEDTNIQALAQAMIRFTKDKDTAERMSIEAKKFVSQFNLEAITDKWEKLIEEIVR